MTSTHHFHLTGAARKPLIEAIEGFAKVKGVYQGAPKFGYDFRGFGVLDKEGSLHFDCDLQVIMDCVTWLENCGFACTNEDSAPKRKGGILDALVETLNETAEDGEHFERLHSDPTIIDNSGREHKLDGKFAAKTEYDPDNYDGEAAPNGAIAADLQTTDDGDLLTIEYPLAGFTPEKLHNLRKLVDSKTRLIKTALGGNFDDEPLSIDVLEDRLQFPWFHSLEPGAVKAYIVLVERLCKTALEKTRISAKASESENMKFAMRVWLISLGLSGSDFKEVRRELMKKLPGDAAFATPESKARWQEKHSKKSEEGGENG